MPPKPAATQRKRGAAARNRPVAVALPASIREEIVSVAGRTGRSVAFLIRRALAAAPAPSSGPPPGPASPAPAAAELLPLELSTDEDDPADTLAKIAAAAPPGVSLDQRVAAAWLGTRDRFLSWAAREEAAQKSEEADELDGGLRDAAAQGTSPERLRELSRSPYPRIRALVAAHPATEPEVLRALAEDRERTVRAQVAENPRTPEPIRARLRAG